MTTQQLLEDMRANDLKRLATLLKVGKGLTRKAEVITALSPAVRDIPGLLKHCSGDEKLALAEAAYAGGKLEPDVFNGKYRTDCPQPVRQWSRKPDSLFGLFMVKDQFGALRLTEDVAEPLQSLLPQPEEAKVQKHDVLPQTWDDDRPVHIHSGENIVFHELRRVLGLAQAGKLAVTAKRATPTEACVRRIAETLVQPDLDLEIPKDQNWGHDDKAGAVRAFAWGVVVQQCGWCKPAGSKLTLTRKGRTMLSDSGADALKEGISRLLNDDSFDELNRINHIRGQTGKGKRSLTKPSERKFSIADSMSEWPVDEWIDFDEAFRFINASGNRFEVSGNEWNLYFCEKQYGSLGYHYKGQRQHLERQYMRAFLMEPFTTLGIIDIAYVYPHRLWPEFSGRWGTDFMPYCGRYDGLLYTRLTRLGAYCLGIENSYEMPEPEHAGLVKVLPNLDLVLVNEATCSPADTARLELFATPKNERIWQLDRKRILEHLESGGSMTDIRKEIDSVTDGEIPATVTTFLDEIEQKASALKPASPCLLIQVNDKATAALIAHDSAASKYCLPAGEKHLAVPKKKERAFRTAVKKLGYVLPR